jgi:hypothetical protein
MAAFAQLRRGRAASRHAFGQRLGEAPPVATPACSTNVGHAAMWAMLTFHGILKILKPNG